MKKVLYFMPDNPLKRNAGNKIRALSFLQYFKSRNFDVHFVSEYLWGEWTEQEILDFENSGLSSQTSVPRRKESRKNRFRYFLSYKIPNLIYRMSRNLRSLQFPDPVTYMLKRNFDRILQKNQYDYIFINYASWASLIENDKLTGNAIKILDTHDFLTAQYKNKHDIGKCFKEEIRRLSLFDKVLSISVEEQYIFSQFCKSMVLLAPMMVKRPMLSEVPVKERKFDLIYVGSNNEHNVKAAEWFIDNVYPLLPKDIEICIIGQITSFIKGNYTNIKLIPFADKLEGYYHNAKIAICPMISGTGTKVKVVEALSYHLPVVCNIRGVDGLVNKSNSGCLVSDSPVEFTKHILNLLYNQELYQKQAFFAQQAFNESYEEEKCFEKLDQIF